MGAAAVGTTLSAYALARLMMNIPSGIIGDTRGRKPLMVWGPAITALGESAALPRKAGLAAMRPWLQLHAVHSKVPVAHMLSLCEELRTMLGSVVSELRAIYHIRPALLTPSLCARSLALFIPRAVVRQA